jgi:hypothetical protein
MTDKTRVRWRIREREDERLDKTRAKDKREKERTDRTRAS